MCEEHAVPNFASYRAPGTALLTLCDKEGRVRKTRNINNVVEIDLDYHEERLERVGAIDVAKARARSAFDSRTDRPRVDASARCGRCPRRPMRSRISGTSCSTWASSVSSWNRPRTIAALSSISWRHAALSSGRTY